MIKNVEPNGHQLQFNCGVCARALTDSTALLTSCGHFFCISPPGKCTRLHLSQAAGTCEQCGKECSAGVPYNRGANNNERVRSFVFDDIVQTLQNVAGIVQFRDEHRQILSENAQNYRSLVEKLQQQNADLKAIAKTRANCRECSRVRAGAEAQLKQYGVLQNENGELKMKNKQLLKSHDGLQDELRRLHKQLAAAQDDVSGYHKESHKLRSELPRLGAVPHQRPVRMPPPSVEKAEQTVRIPSPRLTREALLTTRPRERKVVSAIDLCDDIDGLKRYRSAADRSKALTVSGTGATKFGSDSRIAKSFRGQQHGGMNRRFLAARNSQPALGASRKRPDFTRRFETSALEDGSLRDWRRNDRPERRK